MSDQRTITTSVDEPQSRDLSEMLPGTRYRLESLLGDGGAGEVYQATHLELEKPVAIKVLRQELSTDPDYSARFRREAKAASMIRHPSVVAVTDFGEASDGRLFLVMELIEGETLQEVIELGPLPAARALRITANLCDVLAAVHDAGIVHRDVKPGNTFLVGKEEIKLVDFGIARAGLMGGEDWRITRTGRVCGTPGYMAPEHARNKELDGRADLYSVGAVLYEMLTGHPPFVGDSPIDVMMAQMSRPPEAPSRKVRDTGITKAVDKLALRLLAVKREDRFENGRSVAELARSLADQIDKKRPSKTSDMMAPTLPTSKSRIATIVAALVVIVGAVTGAVAGYLLLGPERRGDQTPVVQVPPPQDHGEPKNSAPAADPSSGEGEPKATKQDGGQRPDKALLATAKASGVSKGHERLEKAAEAPDKAPEAPPPVQIVKVQKVSKTTPTPREPEKTLTAADLLNEARAAFVAGRAAEAETLYQRALAAGANRTTVNIGLGRVYLRQSRYNEAAAKLTIAVAARPGSASLGIDCGKAWLGAGKRNEAITQWRSVLRRHPNNKQAQKLLKSVGADPK